MFILDHTGYFATYSPITKNFRTILPGLKKLPKAQINLKHINYETGYGIKIFSAEYMSKLYFIYPSEGKMVVTYDLESKCLDDNRKYGSKKAPLSHINFSAGVQVGKYFWIILGACKFLHAVFLRSHDSAP